MSYYTWLGKEAKLNSAVKGIELDNINQIL